MFINLVTSFNLTGPFTSEMKQAVVGKCLSEQQSYKREVSPHFSLTCAVCAVVNNNCGDASLLEHDGSNYFNRSHKFPRATILVNLVHPVR